MVMLVIYTHTHTHTHTHTGTLSLEELAKFMAAPYEEEVCLFQNTFYLPVSEHILCAKLLEHST